MFRTLYFWGPHHFRHWASSLDDALLRAIDMGCDGVMLTHRPRGAEPGGYRCFLLTGDIEGTSQGKFYEALGIVDP